MARTSTDPGLLPGTLDLLILKTLSRASLHGYGIAQQIKLTSDDVLDVEEGSLYPALQRLELKKLVESEWRMTPNNRRPRGYWLRSAARQPMLAAAPKYQALGD